MVMAPEQKSRQRAAHQIEQYVFRTTGREIAAPPCNAQGPIPGFSTLFPQLRADPPPGLANQR
jgi:hypothetical protein